MRARTPVGDAVLAVEGQVDDARDGTLLVRDADEHRHFVVELGGEALGAVQRVDPQHEVVPAQRAVLRVFAAFEVHVVQRVQVALDHVLGGGRGELALLAHDGQQREGLAQRG